MLDVTIPESLYAEAMSVGQQRHEHAMRNKLRDKMTYAVQSSLDRHQRGARAEAAVHAISGLPWKKFRISGFKRGSPSRDCDVGPIEVRHKFPHTNRDLFVHKEDWHLHPYLLVYELETLKYRLVGWRFGFEAQQPKFWAQWMPNPVFLVPHSLLYSMSSLIHWCAAVGAPWKSRVPST